MHDCAARYVTVTLLSVTYSLLLIRSVLHTVCSAPFLFQVKFSCNELCFAASHEHFRCFMYTSAGKEIENMLPKDL
jgi:hypothetical protein